LRLLYWLRDLRSGQLYRSLHEHCGGEVLDVGGWDFFLGATRKGVSFLRWTVLENDSNRLLETDDPRVTVRLGDGCAMDFPDASFDTVLCVQVLEHVFEPIRMVAEIGRVLRPGGKAILLIPCTSTMHIAPHYHGNLSRFWIQEALKRAGLESVEMRELGGVWSTSASRTFFFFFQALRYEGMSDPAIKRTPLFWVLLPFQMLFALFLIPISLFFSLGDLAEEPNNHLVVARKRH
jgi:SAM-dependent methyltransferase